ncbi:MAG: amylo-alpha-1,6-glucosidase [Planctomycetota bacterium]
MQQQFETMPEWLETNGMGGFSSGPVTGPRTRRYHALLLVATRAGRFVLLNGFDAAVHTAAGTFPISSQLYYPGVLHPERAIRPISFDVVPWPRWTYELPTGTRMEQELFIPRLSNMVVLSWRVVAGPRDVELEMRPFISGRDYHGLMHENQAVCFEASLEAENVTWRPYAGVPATRARSNSRYVHAPDWYRNFLYTAECQRGLDCVEDLVSPGLFKWSLAEHPAVWLAEAKTEARLPITEDVTAEEQYHELRDKEQRRRARVPDELTGAVDAYLIDSGTRKTIIAGYPWFSDWGRDTFIAMRGLCLATGRLAEAEAILLSWSEHVSDGMLPNRFPDHDEPPQYNSVDASLWYIIAVNDLISRAEAEDHELTDDHRQQLKHAIHAILEGYSAGTRYGIHEDHDGLLAAGQPDIQLTWMDAKVGDWVVTPRVGKPVEVQALWLNALHIGGRWSESWRESYARGLASFRERFWNGAEGCLYDVVDVDHSRGTMDTSLRPNQIFAVGGLPLSLVERDQAKSIVRVVEKHLWTPMGLRTLSADDSMYNGRYQGGVRERDGAYHQGTVWPWLLGPFVEAWVRVRGDTAEARREAHQRFVSPVESHCNEAGLGHISEIADGDPPYTPRGCPFQAWSLGEFIRLTRDVLREKPVSGWTQEKR